ncbi:MAG: DUF4038 domain-containing protein [Caldilineaceae bacterium]
MIINPWREIELTFTAENSYTNPYTDLQPWIDFTHEAGQRLRRPAFWDDGQTWRVRFAPTKSGQWTWRSFCDVADGGLVGRTGEVNAITPATPPSNRFHRHGFWRMSPGGRSLVHADGAPAILVGDTAWGLPWRATEEQCRIYAANRQAKGFNAALLMSVQPDMYAEGPRDRTQDEGFDVGFEDLPTGHINQLIPGYFQHLDKLITILVDHEIVPVLQPVFFGFGWKGKSVAGPVLPPAEYARYCRYLVARYGARPAIYLVGGDGSGYEPPVAAGGAEVELWDAYAQPTGIHYRPHADNCAHQAADWLDFQWCQTGHSGEHHAERVADMWRNTPIKAVANGEPTYENGGQPGKAAGWWQGHEAWSNLCAGGAMGVVYGAGSLWQWVLRPGEPGQSDFFTAKGAGWREAIDFEGSMYVGLVAKILEGLPFTDMQPDWQKTLGRRSLLVPDKFFLVYQEEGGPLIIMDPTGIPQTYRIVDPRTGEVISSGVRGGGAMFDVGAQNRSMEMIPAEAGAPLLYIFWNKG